MSVQITATITLHKGNCIEDIECALDNLSIIKHCQIIGFVDTNDGNEFIKEDFNLKKEQDMPKKDFGYVTRKKYDGMIGRCYRPNNKDYANYGGRGIKMCSAWIKNLNTFRDWIRLELQRIGVSEETFITKSNLFQLDRIDTDGNYTPENCRLIDPQTNIRNQRRIKHKIVVSAEGEEIEI